MPKWHLKLGIQEKHSKQYAEVKYIQLPQKAHDRYLIVDDDAYLLGASVKDMGSGLCAIKKLETSCADNSRTFEVTIE